MNQITLLSGPERRRRWSDTDKLRILEAAFAPGAGVSAVARRFEVSTGLIYTWRRRARGAVDSPGSVQTTARRRCPSFIRGTVPDCARKLGSKYCFRVCGRGNRRRDIEGGTGWEVEVDVGLNVGRATGIT